MIIILKFLLIFMILVTAHCQFSLPPPSKHKDVSFNLKASVLLTWWILCCLGPLSCCRMQVLSLNKILYVLYMLLLFNSYQISGLTKEQCVSPLPPPLVLSFFSFFFSFIWLMALFWRKGGRTFLHPDRVSCQLFPIYVNIYACENISV